MSVSQARGRVYVVATPIGNLEDLSPRAQRILGEVALIACEDTRHTAKLCTHFNISTRRVALHAHNEAARIEGLLHTKPPAGLTEMVKMLPMLGQLKSVMPAP